jgi:hypothetical protein
MRYHNNKSRKLHCNGEFVRTCTTPSAPCARPSTTQVCRPANTPSPAAVWSSRQSRRLHSTSRCCTASATASARLLVRGSQQAAGLPPSGRGYRSRSMADVIASQWRYTRRRDTTYEMEEYDATIDALFHAAAPGCSGESATVRFTPTCVGTTFSTMPRLYYPSVHPHVRGNNVVTGISPVSSSGSPPRAWGQRQATRENVPEQRFTPTCVGTTIGNGDRRRTASVYLSSEGSPALCVENA